MIVEQVTERTYGNTTGISRGNFGAILLPNYIVVIDSGMYPSVAKEFRTYIENTWTTPITYVVLTHYHSDHVFGNQVFKDCQIIANRDLSSRMQELTTSQWTHEKLEEASQIRPDAYGKINLNSFEITFPSVIFDQSITLFDEECLIIIKQVGGHTLDSTYVYFPNEQVLFSGDLIFAHMFPWGGDPTVDPDTWIRTLKTFQQMNIKKIIPGHGPVCDLREVQTYLDFFEPVTKTIKDLIANGRTVEEVVNYDDYPTFYSSENPERRNDTLARWYEIYKAKVTPPL